MTLDVKPQPEQDPERGASELGESFFLLERFKRGDKDALAKLLAAYESALLRCARIELGAELRRQHESCDVIHDVYAEAIERLEDFEYRGKGSILRYLKQVARSRIRNLARRPRIDSDPARDPFWVESLPAADESVSAPLRRAEVRAILDDCMSRLPERERQIVISRKIFEASWEDIQAELDFPSRDAAYQCYQRAKQRLFECAGPRLHGWLGDD